MWGGPGNGGGGAAGPGVGAEGHNLLSCSLSPIYDSVFLVCNKIAYEMVCGKSYFGNAQIDEG